MCHYYNSEYFHSFTFSGSTENIPPDWKCDCGLVTYEKDYPPTLRNMKQELLEQRRMVLEKILSVGGNAANMELEISFWQPQLDKIDELIAKTELRDNY